MPFSISRPSSKTWREVVEAQGSKYGVKEEVLDWFDSEVKRGIDESQAAWEALYEWDALDYEEP